MHTFLAFSTAFEPVIPKECGTISCIRAVWGVLYDVPSVANTSFFEQVFDRYPRMLRSPLEVPVPDDFVSPSTSAPAGLAEPAFDPNALRVLKERYFAKKADGTVENPREFVWRVASAIAQPERRYAEKLGRNASAVVEETSHAFYDMMARRDFMPNTPCLVNAGRPLSMLSACFVLPVPDSIEGIFYNLKAMALIQKSGGGTGFAFSELRHQGAEVESTGKDASGPVSFMKVFNAATDSIKQGGVRRGANMGVLRVDHPDVFQFMSCKKELDAENRALWNRMSDTGRYTPDELAHLKQELLQTQINNFNISVGVTDDFMAAVKADGDFDLRDPRTHAVARTVKAREIWDAIVEGAWQNGEPGVLFLDHPEINPLPGLGPIAATNPCGEQYLHGYDSCNLGSINVGHFYDAVAKDVDWERLAQTTALALRFLDNVIDANIYPIDEIEKMVTANRRVGLGIMGFAELLIQMRVAYGSPEAIAFAGKLMAFIQQRAEETSELLARERGDFPNKHLSTWADDARPRRNAALLSIAPTGTISMIAGCSFGCEPYFGMAYTKHVMKDAEGRPQHLYYVIPLFEQIARAEDFYSEELLGAIEENRGSVKGLAAVPAHWQHIFTTSADVSVDEHIDMLAAFQKHTCNAVSKTINAPNDDTRENVSRAIFRAYEAGCKGFTYYRDGSRTEQVVTFSKDGDLAGGNRDVTPLPEPALTIKTDELDIAALLAKANALLEVR
jgi:ribonucleoside-diphosphate reductase alpha chain